MSETALTDSTAPNGSSLTIFSPTSGNSTKTISPSSSCANSVIPTVAVLPSTRTHSCSFEYLSPSGISIGFPPSTRWRVRSLIKRQGHYFGAHLIIPDLYFHYIILARFCRRDVTQGDGS